MELRGNLVMELRGNLVMELTPRAHLPLMCEVVLSLVAHEHEGESARRVACHPCELLQPAADLPQRLERCEGFDVEDENDRLRLSPPTSRGR